MSSKNKQLTINTIAQMVSFFVNLGITFFITPYIVSTLGTEAYGFVGLATNFVNYAQLITIVLNAMAGRFITICYHQGNIQKANQYFSSLFFANMVITLILFLASIATIECLDSIVHISPNLVLDVKVLFALTFLQFLISIAFNGYNVATFIKNRLELSSLRTIFSNIIRTITLVLAFTFFSPAVWYIGLAAVLAVIYVVITNINFLHRLTPELHVSILDFQFSKIKELISTGVWNLIVRLGNILAEGFDLLLANWFITPAAMGILAITKSLSRRVLSFFGSINGAFAPLWTKLYAEGRKDELAAEIQKSIRIFGFISALPLACIFAYGDWFYKLWLPKQDAHLLYLLTILSIIDLPFTMPQQPLQNIFTITNRVKVYSLFTLAQNICIFICIVLGIRMFNNFTEMLIVLASVRSFWNLLKALTFLPIYSAYCSNLKWSTFYDSIFKSIFSFVIATAVSLLLKQTVQVPSWGIFTLFCAISLGISSVLNYMIILRKEDRLYLKQIFIKKIWKKK